VGCIGHRFSSTSKNNIGIAGHNRLGSKNDSFHAGCTYFVDGCANNRVRETTTERTLSGRILTEAVKLSVYALSSRGYVIVLGGQDISEEYLLDILRLDFWNALDSTWYGS